MYIWVRQLCSVLEGRSRGEGSSRSGDSSFVTEESIALMSGRVSTTGAPGAVSRSAACAPKRRVANCFAAVGIVDGVVGEVEEAQVG